MSQQTLDEINNDLNQKDSRDDILRRLRVFYFYYNEPNEATHTVLIHRAQCCFCRFGAGHNNDMEPGRNGAWVGTFSTPEQAVQFSPRHFPYLGGNVGRCSCV